MVDKRKSLSKCPYQCRRSRRSTPDLLFPYLPGPELFLSPPMLTVQTMPVYPTSSSGSSLNNASSFITGHASFVDCIAPLGLNLVPSNSGLLYTESDVVEDLSIRSTTQSVFPLWMDWCGPSGPSTSYIAPVWSDPMIPISRNPYSDIQRFYQDFRLPNYTLDTFFGRLFDVISSTTFISGDVQTELHHAITRLIVSAYVFKFLFIINFFYQNVLFSQFWIFDYNFSFLCTDYLTYTNQGCVILLTMKPA